MPFLFLVFIVLPVAELYVIIKVGGAIGILPTLALMLLTATVGASLAASQGRSVWARFNQALGSGQVPAREVFDGGMIIFGGALLLSPGFITDGLGIAMLLPPTRALFRRLLRRAAARTPQGRPVFFVYDRFGQGPGGGARSGPSAGAPPRSGAGGPGSTGAGPRPGPSPWDQPGPGAGAPASRSYDVEGSAREIGDEQSELPAQHDESADADQGPEHD